MLVECRVVDGLGEGRHWSRSCPRACEKGHNEHKAIQMLRIEPRVPEEMLVRIPLHVLMHQGLRG